MRWGTFRIKSRGYYIASCVTMFVLAAITVIAIAIGYGLEWIMILVVLGILSRIVRDMYWHWTA